MRARTLIPILTVALLLATVQIASAQAGGDPEHGGELYVENCAVCHGVDGQGRVGASLESFPGVDVGVALEAVIAAGIPGSVMPAWSQANGGPLADQDIRDIAAYIVSAFGGTQPIEPLPTFIAPTTQAMTDADGDVAAGAAVYMANCAVCHGDRGEGRFGLPLAKVWAVVNPPAYIHQVVSQGIQGSTMPAWARPNGGPLEDKEIADVTAFLLSLEPASVPTPVAGPSAGPMGSTATLILLAVLAAVLIVILVVYYRRARPD
jgi:mono/diheme cytochrome c family protein